MESNNWFHALLALLVLTLGGIGGLTMLLHNMTWKKLDRITALFMSAKTEIENHLTEQQKTLTNHGERIAVLESKIGVNL